MFNIADLIRTAIDTSILEGDNLTLAGVPLNDWEAKAQVEDVGSTPRTHTPRKKSASSSPLPPAPAREIFKPGEVA